MAQTYLELFRDSAETAYATGATPLMGLAALNSGVKFIPVKAGGVTKFNIDRLKRIKGKANAAKTAKFGTDLVSQLDELGKVEWDTVITESGDEQIIGVWIDINEEADFLEDASAYESAISERIQNILLSKEENAIEKVAGAGTKIATSLTVDGSADAEMVKAIEAEVNRVTLLVDDFKAYSDKVAVLVHPLVAQAFARVQGQAYQTGTNTFPEGLGQSFRFNGVDFFVSPLMNAIPGATAAHTVGAIVFDTEAYANAGLEAGLTAFDETYLGERVAGHKYFDLDVVVDPSRISVFEFSQATGNKVNA